MGAKRSFDQSGCVVASAGRIIVKIWSFTFTTKANLRQKTLRPFPPKPFPIAPHDILYPITCLQIYQHPYLRIAMSAEPIPVDAASMSTSTSSLWNRITTWASENKAVVYTIAGTVIIVTGAGAVYYFSDSRRNKAHASEEKKKSKKERRKDKKKAEEEKDAAISLKDEEARMSRSPLSEKAWPRTDASKSWPVLQDASNLDLGHSLFNACCLSKMSYFAHCFLFASHKLTY